MVSLCIPTLTRYDLLVRCINSAEEGYLKPDTYYIIDNGGNLAKAIPNEFVQRYGKRLNIFTPKSNLGVAASWNVFLSEVPEIRIIANDDIFFHKGSIQSLVNEQDPNTISCASEISLNAFSLFIIPDSVVKNIGKFDETISPNWAYFEDNDYAYRMRLKGFDLFRTSCYVNHFGSATLKSLDVPSQNAHHRKFEIAKANYIKKWGGEPGREVYKTPYNT